MNKDFRLSFKKTAVKTAQWEVPAPIPQPLVMPECILSTGVLQTYCWPDLPCPTCLWWLLLKKSLKISQCNIPRRDVTSVSLPKLPSCCNTRPRCELSIWWLPEFNHAGADHVLGWLTLQKQPSCHHHCYQTPLLSGSERWSMAWSSLSKPGVPWHHLRILCIASALRCSLIKRFEHTLCTITEKVCWGCIRGTSALAWILILTSVTSAYCICSILYFSLFHTHSSSSAWLSSGAENKDKGDPMLSSPLHHTALE